MTTGSYNFDSLHNTDFQADRLAQQAQATRAIEENLLRATGLKEDHDVLEIGCGPGHVSNLLASLAPQGSLHAVEPSATLARAVQGNVRTPPARGLFVHEATGDKLPLPDQSIDFAYARFVLQHIPDTGAVLRETLRVLRPGGRLCIVDSDDGLIVIHPPEPRLEQILAQAQQAQTVQGGDRFIGRKLQGQLLAHGFSDVRSRIVSMTSTELPFPLLFNILFGYKASHMGQDIDLSALADNLTPEVTSGQRLIAAGVFIVTGIRSV